MTTQKPKFLVVAGEASGDTHAAKLVNAIREELSGEAEFFGAAGPKMRAAGVEAVVKSDELSVVGLIEIAGALGMFWDAFKKLRRAALERRPDAAILVDFPDFNLKLAKSLSKRGIKVIYYISPQIWAWRKYRISTIRKYVDLVITILPFEKDWYAANGVHHVEYVGSPVAREVEPDRSKEEFCRQRGLDPSQPIIALLPGSRHKEIVRILPELLKTAAVMKAKDDRLQFVTAFADERQKPEWNAALEKLNSDERAAVEGSAVVFHQTFNALNAADAAAVTSGTATLETGIIGTPMAIVYKTSPLNYKLLRPLIDVSHFGLINLIAEKRVAKELIQDDFTPETLSQELFELLEPERNQIARRELAAATDKLGHGGASKRAAEAILKALAITPSE